jgi:tryptophan 2,3-dioxygenase
VRRRTCAPEKALAEPRCGRGNAALQRRFRHRGRCAHDAWLEIYRRPENFSALSAGGKLVDLDDALAAWRHKHMLTVERIIGMKKGTGGSEGAAYLASTLSKRAFPELWSLRTEL